MITPLESLPSQARMHLEHELRSGESVVWAALPLTRRVLAHLAPQLALGTAWTAIPVALLLFAPGDAVITLLSLPFIIVGAIVITGIVRSVQAHRDSVVAVTDRRLLKVGWGRACTVQWAQLEQLAVVDRTQRSDGTGNVTAGFRVDFSAGDRDGLHRIATVGLPGVEAFERVLRGQARLDEAAAPAVISLDGIPRQTRPV